ncbi:FHA domain-containing protein [Variovorax sp. RT4R15]|uniref:FHA domain-containing protein n=1 Tax=Variovorax sp. RT4R15 TaxID=3443737 RepID=UPI003F466474
MKTPLQPTVVFADLTGITRVFDAVGNARATETVSRLLQWIGGVCESHRGRIVKTRGEGVFAMFPDGASAVGAVLELQRNHQKRLTMWPAPLRMDLQIGVASSKALELDGDAVTLASRLSGLAGPGQIWATQSVIDQLGETGVRYRSLGPINVRGRSEPPVVHRIDWHAEVAAAPTVPASLASLTQQSRPPDSNFGQIERSWLDVRSMFRADELPIHVGRVNEADFVINDPRVSRLHARIEARQGTCVLVDISTFGTWVRFHGTAGANGEIALRRGECVLHGSGEIGLGAPLSDFSAPTISFNTTGGSVLLERKDAR